MLDRTGADLRAWFKAIEYSAYIAEVLARKTNKWKIPWEIATGEHLKCLNAWSTPLG